MGIQKIQYPHRNGNTSDQIHITNYLLMKPDYSKQEMTWRHEVGNSKYRVLYLKNRDIWVRYSTTPFCQPDTYGQGGWPTYQYLLSLGWKVVSPTENDSN